LIDAREDEESIMPMNLRNLNIMPIDDEHMVVTARKDEEFP
jgi:hypothetical protein